MGNFFAARNGYLLVKRGKQRENWGRSECKEKACDKGLLYFLRGLLPMMLPKHHQDIGKVLGDLGDFEKKRFQTHVILDFFSTWCACVSCTNLFCAIQSFEGLFGFA